MLNYFLNCSKKALLGHPVFMFLGSSMTKSGKPIVEQQFAWKAPQAKEAKQINMPV